MKTVVASGYFNPLHKGHVRYLQAAKELGDRLIVVVNNDMQVRVKGSQVFMDEEERCEIVQALKCVDDVRLSIDTDNTVCKSLESIKPYIFAKGGDSTEDNVPEKEVCEQNNIILALWSFWGFSICGSNRK